jgi:hypothetical protein
MEQLVLWVVTLDPGSTFFVSGPLEYRDEFLVAEYLYDVVGEEMRPQSWLQIRGKLDRRSRDVESGFWVRL